MYCHVIICIRNEVVVDFMEILEVKIDAFDETKSKDHHFYVEKRREQWFKDGTLHRFDGPAVVIRDDDGSIVFEEWYRDGVLHRDNGPARTAVRGEFQSQTWTVGGQEHRECAPSHIEVFLPSGLRTEERWMKHGELHRVGGPARTTLDEKTCVVDSERWALHGKTHRLDGPAVIIRDGTTGVMVEEYWVVDGKEHREDGPAIIFRDPESQSPVETAFYRHGVQNTPGAPGNSLSDGPG